MSHDTHEGFVQPPTPHVLPAMVYWGVFATLAVLTVITVASAQLDLGPFNLPLAMLIAGTKATLVALVFMHLWFDNKLNAFIVMASLFVLATFIVLVMFDTEGRSLVDHQRRNYLPRDQAVQRYETENPGALPLRPALKKPADVELKDPHAGH